MRYSKEPIEEVAQEFVPRNDLYRVKRSKKKKHKKKGPNSRHNKYHQEKEKKSLLHEIYDYIISIVIALGVLFLLYTYVGYPFTISGDSMYPTLHDGDKMIMSKLNSIDRFDIVVVDSPDETEKYIKRVIGMPGDEISVFQGQLFINNELVEQPFINQDLPPDEKTVTIDDFSLYGLTGERVVPEGKYFVMGDNRGVSKDSRMIGFISKEHILGEAVFTFWPIFPDNRVGMVKKYPDLYVEQTE
ncbi:signal peptidase I [Granulicatella balaenopterae]|uniref:Signal peptidase I n=1 Tax=Granulicatella balaenopterae TaxID=137733 RepID=A0A1H9K3X7_9LACT|nr:signal peptidase I [Granulicatella balaenopterae]SEQ93555.1 signal peptidase I [Granulicatella balaenopterae]